MKDAPRLSGFTACNPADPPTGGRAGRFGAAVRGGLWTKDAPRLSGFTACNPAEPPTGGRPQRPGGASSVGDPTGLLRGPLTFHFLWVARSAVEN
jgi:hypothetical protein